MNLSGRKVISLNRGSATPNNKHTSAPTRRDGIHRNTNVSKKMNGGQRYEGMDLFSGRVKAMIPGKKLGTKISSENHASAGIVCGKCPRSPQANQSASSFQNERFFQRNKNGSARYICTSIGSDHSGPIIELEYVRF